MKIKPSSLSCLSIIVKSCSLILIFTLEANAASPVVLDEDKREFKLKALQQVIDKQQKQLDTQQTQLNQQNINLQQYRQQLQTLNKSTTSIKKVTAASSSSIPSRRNDLQTQRRDNAQSLDDWEGSFALKGTNTRVKIGGFVELDVIHDTSAIKSKGQVIPGSISTRNAANEDGANGQTNFSVSPTRLYIETRTPVNHKRVKTFVSMDMFDDELGVDARPRLRQGYVEFNDMLFGGDLLIGQAWSTTTDLESSPDVLDFRGVDALFGQLQPQVRWTKQTGKGVKLMLALETPTNHIIEGADSLTRFPDSVIALTWDSKNFYLMASLLTTDLRASAGNSSVDSTVGLGTSFSGKVKLPFGKYENNFLFSTTYGRGIGSHFNNSVPDAVFNTNNSSIETLLMFAVGLGYEHGWNAHTRSTLTYCCIEIYNNNLQAPDSLQGTEYSSANLMWDVNTYWLIGVEGIWAKREDKDNKEAANFRSQFTSRLSF